jgi:hypothetical protein
MAIGSETPHQEQQPSFGASPLHEFLLSSPTSAAQGSPLRRRPLPPPIQSTPSASQQPRLDLARQSLHKEVSKSLQKLERLGSRKKNRLKNHKELLESSPVLGSDYPALDWDLISTPRKESAFLKLLESPNLQINAESIGDLLEEMDSSDSSSFGKNSALGQDNLSPTDKGLRQNLRRCLYGKDEMLVFEKQIRDWIESFLREGASEYKRSYCVEDKLMRLLMHALCRFYGLSSYSENDPLDMDKRKTYIVLDRSPKALPHESFCSYFYGSSLLSL